MANGPGDEVDAAGSSGESERLTLSNRSDPLAGLREGHTGHDGSELTLSERSDPLAGLREGHTGHDGSELTLSDRSDPLAGLRGGRIHVAGTKYEDRQDPLAGRRGARQSRDGYTLSERSDPRAGARARDGVSEPYGSHYFMLEVDGQEVAHILQVSGIKTQSQVFEVEEGGNTGFAHKRVGQGRWENVTIRYATSSSRYLQAWRDSFLRNPFGEGLWRSGSIVMFNNHGDPIRRFHFGRAWPVGWEGPSLDSGTSELSVESLELAHEGISVSDG